MSNGLPDIQISFPGGKRVTADFGAHQVPTDQPVADGGENSAPAPFLIFLSSLATCAGIFVLNYCQSRQIPTEGIHLKQSHEYLPNEQGKLRLGRIRLDIVVPPDFPQQHHATLVRVAEQCAVKRVLENPPEFVIATRVSEV